MCLFFFKKLNTDLQDKIKGICNISELFGGGMVTRGVSLYLRGTKNGGNQMNKSSLDSERVNGGKEEDGGRNGILPEFKLLFSSSIKSSPVMLRSHIWESCTDTNYYIPLLYATLETGEF